ncbi:response regulator transcription factor [Streptomyces sp. t39]|uniref:response regulator transcription factor n=1 Tax=Streptomyces sp. t39 TaxID=1828156 RepID=UPI0021C64C24|nr:helix-turn-helix transcriptional regulator [Streptomyces sp. t39]
MRATRYGLPLVERELEVLRGFAHGASYAELAASLYLAQPSVRNYASSAIKKLGAANQTDAVRIAYERGLLGAQPAVVLPGPLVQVLQLVAEGCTNPEIARRLERSEHTVVDQVKEVRRRLGARDRAHAAALAVALRIVRVEVPAGSAVSDAA